MGRLRPDLGEQPEKNLLLLHRSDLGQPFAVAAVEDEQFRRRLQPEHVGEIVGLLLVWLDDGVLDKIVRQEQSLHSIVGAHGGVMVRHRPSGQDGAAITSCVLLQHATPAGSRRAAPRPSPAA